MTTIDIDERYAMGTTDTEITIVNAGTYRILLSGNYGSYPNGTAILNSDTTTPVVIAANTTLNLSDVSQVYDLTANAGDTLTISGSFTNILVRRFASWQNPSDYPLY